MDCVVKVVLLKGGLKPERQHRKDAGLDLKIPVSVRVESHSHAFVDTGVCIELPKDTVGIIKSRSSLNKKGFQCEGGVIDENYRGSIGLILYNHTDNPVTFMPGQRVAQLLVLPCLYPTVKVIGKLSESERGTNGFGSTGEV